MNHADTAILATYNLRLVILSVGIAILASYTALDLAGRVTVAIGHSRQLWLAGGAVVMGIGIWSMHFIGMLAYCLPMPISYELSRVWISMLVAIIASGAALWLVSRQQMGGLQLLLGGIFMGSGIAAMHYTGMEAMQLKAVAHYDIFLVAVSVAVAIAASLSGLWLGFQLRDATTKTGMLGRFGSAIVMGNAIAGMHYIGMTAISFTPTHSSQVNSFLAIDNSLLALLIGIATLFLLGLPLIASFFDQRLNIEIAKAETLRQSEERFRALVQNASDLISVVTADGTVRYISTSLQRILGYDPSDWLGKKAFEFVYREDRTIAKNLLTEALSSKALNLTTQLRLQHASGRTRDFEVIANNLLHLTNVAGIVITYRDITEQKQVLEALRQSEQNARSLAQREALINRLAGEIRNSLDLNTILETAVSEIRSLLQIDRCQFLWCFQDAQQPILALSNEARSPSLPSLLGNYSNSEVASLVNQIQNLEIIQIDDVKSDNNLNPTQRELLTSFGVTSQLLLPIQTHTNQMGAIVCSHCSGTRSWSKSEVELLKAVVDQLAIAIDQSQLYTSAHATAAAATAQAEELQQTLQKLQQTQVQLIQTAKMSSLGQMIAGIAHELNNPVTFIYGNVDPASEYAQSLLHLLQLYQQHYPQPPASIQAQREAMDFDFLVQDFPRLLTSLKMGAIRIHDLVVSLRNFSRLDEAEKKVVDIHEGIDNTLLILGNRLKSKSGHPTLEIVKKYGQLPKVECSAGQLNQVFMNLLNNAIDALENQPPPRRITIVTEVLADTNLVRIRICDTGKGITEEAKTHLFDPFFTTKPVGQGTGLGLSISYQIVVEKHDGSLKCFSELGQGTEFWVEIPIVQSQTLPKVSSSRSSSRSFNVAYDLSRLCS